MCVRNERECLVSMNDSVMKVCANECAEQKGRHLVARNALIALVHPAGLEPAAF